MPLGFWVRQLLGPRLALHAGRLYRSIYVDLAKVASTLAPLIPQDAHLLDIGGGDGQPLNYLLALRPDLKVTTLDPAPIMGQWIEPRYLNRVTRLPSTTLTDYAKHSSESPDAILIADVLHHIPDTARRTFLQPLVNLMCRLPTLKIILKDVEPGHWRASLGCMSDRYITGDKNVNLISRAGAMHLFEAELGPLRRYDTNLFEIDKPNYAIVLQR